MSIKAIFLNEDQLHFLEYQINEIMVREKHHTSEENQLLLDISTKCAHAVTGKSVDVVCSRCGMSAKAYQLKLFGNSQIIQK